MGLTTKFLMHPEATYLVINLCEGHYGSSQRGRVSLTRVGFTYIDDEPYAIDLDTAEVLGEMNEIATTAYDRWKPEYSYTSPMKEAAYHGFVFGSPSPRSSRTFDKWVLPLTGPALQHAAFRRQAEFATDILLGKVPAIETLLALDTVNAEIEQEDDRQEAIVRSVIDEAVAQYVPAEWDAELVRLMESMDWTFDYADRPNSAFYDQRQQIERRLHALPLEVAIAFLHSRRTCGSTPTVSSGPTRRREGCGVSPAHRRRSEDRRKIHHVQELLTDNKVLFDQDLAGHESVTWLDGDEIVKALAFRNPTPILVGPGRLLSQNDL